ncbi:MULTISPECIES: Xaa-Pro peptidase family protein [Halobacterium]|uniref:M24 family metallopeptidase n=1 Tax=Halobacterium TaxID=2239 RepID=UPI00073EF336|nr:MULTISPECIES: Xaa-Pro peptidase family protein [Halobacterium]MCG1003360.1 Xaa-Pro peptidase family protein [Halobacterium noricense]
MDPDFSRLDEFLDERGLDGYAFHDDDSNSDLYYTTGFSAPDPFFAVYTPEATGILTGPLEYGRAKSESRADVVARLSEYGFDEKRAEHGAETAYALAAVEFLGDVGCESLAVQRRFPVAVADELRAEGVSVDPDDDGVVSEIRATKTDEEVEHVRAAQKANEAAMARAEELIRGAEANDDGELVFDGDVLTSEYVKREIEIELLRHGCALDETIVACGRDAADPHNRGSGPLEAGEFVVVDIFPRDKDSKYHADMTRTFLNGDASDSQQEWYDVTHEAMEAALDVLEPGATGEDVNQAVVDVYDDHGFPTIYTEPETETGFIHSTGHGVGLDVHEEPALSVGGPELRPGHVVTIEPGLYDPDVGGVRIEDIVVVTEDGYENLTEYEISLAD